MAELAYNEQDGIVTVEGRDIELSPREAQVFDMLWAERPLWVRTSTIESKLFGNVVTTDNVKIFVMRMRRKGVPIGSRPGWGYSLAYRPWSYLTETTPPA